jgi:hypothetical protein
MPTAADSFQKLCTNFTNETRTPPHLFKKIYAQQNEPERHSFLLLLEINFKPKDSNSCWTSKNSDFKIPARTKNSVGLQLRRNFFTLCNQQIGNQIRAD